jgi:glycogen debranching enzyme
VPGGPKPIIEPDGSVDVPAHDGAYHQGTIWPWLLGPYIDAVPDVRGCSPEVVDGLPDRVRPLVRHLADDACLGGVSEVMSGDPPHQSGRGATQVRLIAELLRICAMFVDRQD